MADEAPQRFSSAEKQMNSTHRVVINTLTTYVRSVFGAGLALFTSRWVLNALGQTDFGLYNVVGSILFFVTFFSATFAAASSRYFAYSIGEGNLEDTNRWFNAALLLHALLAAVLILGGWPIGEYFIKYHLTIPPDRLAASIYVFRLHLEVILFPCPRAHVSADLEKCKHPNGFHAHGQAINLRAGCYWSFSVIADFCFRLYFDSGRGRRPAAFLRAIHCRD